MYEVLKALRTDVRLTTLEGWPHAFDYHKPIGNEVRGAFWDAVGFLKERV
jgi:hypothetical protein